MTWATGLMLACLLLVVIYVAAELLTQRPALSGSNGCVDWSGVARDGGGSMIASPDYLDFLTRKTPIAVRRGLSRMPAISSHLFPFQKHCLEFLLGVGSGGLFLDTGLGKTLVQLEYAEHARQVENGKALILTPLAVAKQIEREAHRFVRKSRLAATKAPPVPTIIRSRGAS